MVQRRHDQQVMGCKDIRKLRTGKGPFIGLVRWQIGHGDLRVLMSETTLVDRWDGLGDSLR